MTLLVFGLEESLAKLMIWLSASMYYIAAFFFKVFLILANGELVSADDYQIILNNSYIIIGVVMLFVIAFNLLKGMVNPEEKKSTEAIKKMIVNFITSMIMIILLPTIFGFAFDFQNAILVKQNTIGKFFGFGDVGSSSNNSADDNAINKVQAGANMIVNGVWTAFFNVNPEGITNCYPNDLNGLTLCQNQVYAETKTSSQPTLAEVISEVNQNGSFYSYDKFAKAMNNDEIDYSFLLSLLGGFLLVYIGISYCIDMGVRLVKLVFYQIIAPIPILLRIIPDGKLSGTFNKWLQITITCYLEVFIRIIVLYFCVYLCVVINDSEFLENVFGYGWFTWLITKAFIFMGIIMFMKQAPKLISDITGIDSGNMRLGLPDKFKEVLSPLDKVRHGAAMVGAGVGGFFAGGGFKNPLAGVRSAFNAGKSGLKNGNLKGIGAEAQRRQAYKDALASGATRTQMALNAVRGTFGYGTTAESAERKINTGGMDVENNSANDIEYVDGKGKKHIIKSGDKVRIDDVKAEELKAQKIKNVGKMADANDKIGDLDKQIKWAGSQKSWKSAMDDEAEKKFNDGKYEHNIRYMDSSGNIYQEKVNGKRLSELSQQGMKFLYADESQDKFMVSYIDDVGNRHDSEEVSKARYEALVAEYGKENVNSSRIFITEKQMSDDAIASFVTNELSSDSPNLIKNKTESFFNTLASEGEFTYQSYVYDKNGRQQYNDDGTAVIESGNFTSRVEDGERIITHNFTDKKGNAQRIEYKSIGNGMLEYTDEDGYRKEMSVYDLSDMFDKKSKSTTGVLEAAKQAIAEGEEFIRARNENEAIDAILKTREEKVAEVLQDRKQRSREAAKNYRANRK